MKPPASKNPGILIIWEFHIRQSRRKRFEEIYGPRAAWAEFFRKDKHYLRTELFRDPRNPLRYWTLDLWTARAAYQAFKKRYADAYETIDRECKDLTTRESLIGYFEAG